MNNTVPETIFSSLETFIAGAGGLDPAGGEPDGVGGHDTYEKVSDTKYNGDPEKLAGSDIDRRFALDGMDPDELDIEGLSTTNVHTGSFTLSIGHKIGQWTESRGRRTDDLHQLVAQLIRLQVSSSAISGVQRIWAKGSSRDEIKDNTFWWTTLEFGIIYNVSANYGG